MSKNHKSYRKDVLATMAARRLAATTAIGILVEGAAVTLCPVDTGQLRGSIGHHADSDKVVLGANTDYAHKVEKGIGQRPQPYLEPAVMRNRERISDLAKEVLRG